MISEVYLGLGSNLGDRAGNINRSIKLLRADSTVAAVSSLYETEPQGFQGQPPFLNAACRLWTRLDPFRLMARLVEIEASVGRERAFANAPRTVDIDILLYDETVVEVPGLSIPHPRMDQREFVLVPLAEIAPAVRHPVLNRSVASLLADIGGQRGFGTGLRQSVPWRDSRTGRFE